jgi:DNA-binding Xre family transcriptional regulator
MTTGFRLRDVMEGRPAPPNLSELARASGVSYPTVRAIYHNATTRVDLATLDALAQALGCEPGQLIGKAGKRGKEWTRKAK